MVHIDEKYMRRLTCFFKLVDSEEYSQMLSKDRAELESYIVHEETKIFICNLRNFGRESRKRNLRWYAKAA